MGPRVLSVGRLRGGDGRYLSTIALVCGLRPCSAPRSSMRCRMAHLCFSPSLILTLPLRTLSSSDPEGVSRCSPERLTRSSSSSSSELRSASKAGREVEERIGVWLADVNWGVGSGKAGEGR